MRFEGVMLLAMIVEIRASTQRALGVRLGEIVVIIRCSLESEWGHNQPKLAITALARSLPMKRRISKRLFREIKRNV
jgi:hypothetical protein